MIFIVSAMMKAAPLDFLPQGEGKKSKGAFVVRPVRLYFGSHWPTITISWPVLLKYSENYGIMLTKDYCKRG
ncbi:hypothetical protein AB3331_07925 [Streptococcus sp. H49]|uniref:hypothetical protein n=1 Tax=Streptococcus huangxiaojuni TaxID=3237239 RepID=UPI0034A226B0